MADTLEGRLNATLCSETANSYCNTQYAVDYWADHYDTVKAAQWAALSSVQQQGLLIRSCRVIEGLRFTIPVSLYEYGLYYNRRSGKVIELCLDRQPVKYLFTQSLQFPRNLDVYVETAPIGTTYMRSEVMDAQCEQAIYLLNFDETAIANRVQGITMEKISVGKQAIDFTQEYGTNGSSLAPAAYEMLRALVVKGGRMQRS